MAFNSLPNAAAPVSISSETDHVLTILKTAFRVLGDTNRDVERKLKLSSSYLSRLFSGMIELKFQHIVDIARAIGMEPEEMLYLVYPSPNEPPTEAAARIRRLLGGPRRRPASFSSSGSSRGAQCADAERHRGDDGETIRKLFSELAPRES